MDISDHDSDLVSSNTSIKDDSLSLIFQKPDRLFMSLDSVTRDQNLDKAREKLRNGSDIKQRIRTNVAQTNHSVVKENCLPNFSEAFDSNNEESTILQNKKRRSVLKEVNIKSFNFSDAFNSSSGSISQMTNIGFFPKRREFTKSSTDADFANVFQSTAESTPLQKSNDRGNLNLTPPNISVSFNESQWIHNPSKTIRRRRCSTPIQLSKKPLGNEPNISLIPRSPLFTEHNRSLSSNSPLVFDLDQATKQNCSSKSKNIGLESLIAAIKHNSHQSDLVKSFIPGRERITEQNLSIGFKKPESIIASLLEKNSSHPGCSIGSLPSAHQQSNNQNSDQISKVQKSKSIIITRRETSSQSSYSNLNTTGKPIAPAREQLDKHRNTDSKNRGLESIFTIPQRKISFHASNFYSGNASEDGTVSSTSSNSASFVTRVFCTQNKVSEPVLEMPQNSNIPKQIIKKKSDFVRRTVFPKFSSFCGKYFYQFLINKMESKYGIRTKKKVVDVAKYIHQMVEKIIPMEENYQEEVRKMKLRLFRKNVIVKHVDFYYFCQTFLPKSFVLKAVPMIQPMGRPMLAEFDPYTIFDPIES